MKILRNVAIIFLILAQNTSAQVYGLFSPANGILKGQTTTWVTTAAASSDIFALMTGTCNASTLLYGGGACVALGVGDSITGAGTSGSPLILSGDAATPGNSMLYGTNASGVKGWYTQPGGGNSTGTFTGTLTGMSAGGTGTVTYWITNGIACLFATFTGTSNATTLSLTGVPSVAQPTRASTTFVQLENNSVQQLIGEADTAVGSGTITFALYTSFILAPGAVGFTATGTKGFSPSGSFFCYPL